MQRRNPGFNERAHGFKSFRDLLKAAEQKGILKIEIDEKSRDYRVYSVD